MEPPATFGNLVPVLFFVRPFDAALKPRPVPFEAPVPLMPGKRLPEGAPPLSAVRDRPPPSLLLPPLLPRMPLPPPRAPRPFEKMPRPPPVNRESGVVRDKLRRISAEKEEEEEEEEEIERSEWV